MIFSKTFGHIMFWPSLLLAPMFLLMAATGDPDADIVMFLAIVFNYNVGGFLKKHGDPFKYYHDIGELP